MTVSWNMRDQILFQQKAYTMLLNVLKKSKTNQDVKICIIFSWTPDFMLGTRTPKDLIPAGPQQIKLVAIPETVFVIFI